MIAIYGVYRSRATRNIWLCEEMGVPYRQVPVIQVYRLPDPDAAGAPLHTRSPEFLKVNPNGRIPAMVDGDLVLNESLAINLYLAKAYGGALGPANVKEDGLMSSLALWAITEAEPHAINVLYNSIGKPEPERDARLLAASVEALRQPFAVLEDWLTRSGEYLVGGRFTVADVNTAEIFRYAQPATALFDAAPRTKAWIARCQARPAFQKMMAARNAEPA
jgi:glutathione S-transferase